MYLVFPVNLPENDSTVPSSSKAVLFQQPPQYFLCLAAVIRAKERGNEAEEVTMHALRPFHILWRYVTCNRLPECLSGFPFCFILVKRKTLGGTTFRAVVEILLGSIMITATAFMVAPAYGRMQRYTAIVHIVGERMSVTAIRAGMPCCSPFVFL